MRILMISDVYFPRINGVSTSIETFRASLQALGVETTLLAPDYGAGAAHDAQIQRLPSWRVPFDPEDRLMQRGALRRWLTQRRAGEFDLVHVQTPFAAHYAGVGLARRLGIPVIATYHTYFEEYLHHYIPLLPRALCVGLARRFSRSQCNALDAVVVPSRAMATTLEDYGITRPLHVIPTGLPERQFVPGDGAAFRLHHEIPPDRPLLLFVGRVAHEKNIGFLLEMLVSLRQQRPDALLLITGEGPALEALRGEAVRLDLSSSVRFLGYLDRQQGLTDCYQAADLFVFASRTETQGLVLLEAMAQGKPVVALAEMGTRDILVDNPGAFIPPADPAAFASVVAGLLEDRRTLAAHGAAAREAACAWSARAMAARLLTLYQSLGETRRGAIATPAAALT